MIRLCAVFLLFFAVFMSTAAEETVTKNSSLSQEAYAEFGGLLILDGGRLKPLDTFARVTVLQFAGKSRVDGLSSLALLREILVDPDKAYKRLLFIERDRDVLAALNIDPRDGHRYSFEEIRSALHVLESDLQKILARDEKTWNRIEKGMVALFSKAQHYYALSRSFSLFSKQITLQDPILAKEFSVQAGQPYSYVHYLNQSAHILKILQESSQEGHSYTDAQIADLDHLVRQMNSIIRDRDFDQLAMIPFINEEGEIKEEWHAPWRLIEDGSRRALLLQFQALSDALHAEDSAALIQMSQGLAKEIAHRERVAAELFYNKADFFYNSLVLNIAAFIFAMLALIWRWRWIGRAAMTCAVIALTAHTAGLIFRMIIMQRPPVSTLYESVLFAAWAGAIMGLVVEWRRKDLLGLLVASFLAASLHFIGMTYVDEGDTMKMLVAVLNTNFWLATHVTSIVIGYGCALVTGLMAHVALIERILNPTDKARQNELIRLLRGACVVSLLFTTLGTILGGIWADQSWGRFWGWDPKENGALLIVLWLLFVVHGRLAGLLKPLSYLYYLALTPITVAIAWFGVNLLAVGLHSYGFDDSTTVALTAYCLGQLLVASLLYIFAKSRQYVPSKAADDA